jgi:predicted ATPase/DNA-binding winged helix-turn-helix (wHTH) protein
MEHLPALRFGRFELQANHRLLLQDGEAIALGARPFDLLVALVDRRERVVTKAELLDLVWPGLVVEENNLQVQVSLLRKLLGAQVIATIPARGYRFTANLDGAPVAQSSVAASSPFPTRTSADATVAPLTNLPMELPPLYGRAGDLQALRALIDAHRLVSVVGAGGIGKTALAQALANPLRGAFEDGMWLVELAPVADASLVATTVAGVLHVTLGADAQVDTLARALSTSRMLIVLDNCEHLLHAVAETAAALLRTAPNVRLLVTSQEPLKVAQEHVYRLEALALPGDADLESARQSGAIALFEARAREAQRHFALSEQNVVAVIDICRRLDGIALAIELAAARVPLLGVEGLRARLDERFHVLTGGARLALRRHQTLRAALDWSHGLLAPDEQIVFRRLGVFTGGFGLGSAQTVASDDTLDVWAVLDQLGALVDKSLVVAEAGAEPRYRLLETSRAFALEKLHESAETEATLRRHAEALLAVFEGSRKDEYVLSIQTLLDRYLPDLDNMRAALDWSAGETGDAGLHIALAGAIAWIWVDAGLRPEGLRRTRSAMAAVGPDTAPRLEARLLGSWSSIAFPLAGAEELAADARAVELCRSLGDKRALFVALTCQCRTLSCRDRLEEATSALDEAERLFETDWPPALRGPLLRFRGWVLDRQGRYEEGIAVAEELLQLAIAVDDQRWVLKALAGVERSSAALGRLKESVAYGREMARRMRADRSLRSGNENVLLVNLCMSLTQLGQTDEALDVARAVYPLVEQAGRLIDLLDPFALLAFNRGDIDDAARILGRADLRYATGDYLREVVEQKLRDQLVLSLRGAVTPDELSRLMKEGEELSDEDAAHLALRE